MFDPDLYQSAAAFAAAAHAGQTLPDSASCYMLHLANVAMEVMRALELEEGPHPDTVLAAALLHDTLEDTGALPEAIKESFGPDVLKAVQALTKNKNLPKEHRMADSLERIRSAGQAAAWVKLADRITNLQKPPASWNVEKRREYLQEARLVHDQLGGFSKSLGSRLAIKIAEYARRWNDAGTTP